MPCMLFIYIVDLEIMNYFYKFVLLTDALYGIYLKSNFIFLEKELLFDEM